MVTDNTNHIDDKLCGLSNAYIVSTSGAVCFNEDCSTKQGFRILQLNREIEGTDDIERMNVEIILEKSIR